MDSLHTDQATTSSVTPQSQQSSSSTLPNSPPAEPKALRSSARVKAAKENERDDKGNTIANLAEPSSSSSVIRSTSTSLIRPTPSTSSRSKRVRDSVVAKGKVKDVPEDPSRASKRVRRAVLVSAAPLSITEPAQDPKGKKRAAPEPVSEEEEITALTSTSAKRAKTSSYSLRSRIDIPPSNPPEMTRKTRATVAKGKLATKSKAIAASSSRLEDENVELLNTEYKHHDSDAEQHIEENSEGVGDRDEDEGGDGEPEGEAPNQATSHDGVHDASSLDKTAAIAFFNDYRQFGSYMMGLSSRLKTMLANIKATADPTTRLLTLQELSELLSISTEDTLAGSFQVEQFVRELVRILGGQGAPNEDDDDGDDDRPEREEDAALAAALALSTGNATYQGDENLEAQVLACRCLANLMEALPGVAHTVVYHGAIPVLCSKLIEISYIDLAEQTLSTLEKISEEFPSSIVREGGLAALLNYLDFFSIAVQRTALQAASNCCRNVTAEHFPMIRAVWPIIRNCLSYSDQRLVEFACLCLIRVVDSYHRSSVKNLESLVDTDLIRAVNLLLLPPGGSPLIPSNTYTLLLRALATSARASPKVSIALLEADIVDTLYQILTGFLPPASVIAETQGGSTNGHGLGGGLADMTVMENLAYRPKDQVEEALGLISELMPPLPKDGVFDHKSYTEKALARLIKARAKAERAAARHSTVVGSNAAISSAPLSSSTATTQDASSAEAEAAQVQALDVEDGTATKESVVDRAELLRSKSDVVGHFMQLMVPILVDVYAASVVIPIRVKCLTALLKAVSFLSGDGIKRVLKFVPLASFASSILSSKDHPSLVIGALQLVDLLLTKVPEEYKPTFRREGVFHEIEVLASKSIVKSKDKDKDKESSESASPADSISTQPPLNSTSSAAAIPGFKKLSSLSLEPDDAITLRARVIRFKHVLGGEQEAKDSTFDHLRSLVMRLSAQDANEKTVMIVLRELAELFASPRSSVSSFELLQSGLVDGLLQFTTDESRKLSVQKRREIFFDAFVTRKVRGILVSQAPFSTLVKRLQESLTRMESFEVVSVAQGVDDSKRSSPSLLARQLRLRLVAGEDSDIPRNLHNVVVSIHAIATFQALHDYLRPRVSGLLSGNPRLSGMLAALATSGLGSSASRKIPEEAAPVPPPPPPESSSTAMSNPTVPSGRRRSLRLSAKNATTSEDPTTNPVIVNKSITHELSDDSIIENTATAAEMDDAPLAADFTDDEMETEVINEEEPDPSISDKTVNLSIADDGSKIEAQTPDGTRVGTPSVSKDATSSTTLHQPSLGKTSYAAALMAKPSDWHLEFSMDDQVLPLDLTIYGAIHQHEMRKKGGALPHSLIWQGMYTVKFRKVNGPPPTNENRPDGLDVFLKSRATSPNLSSFPEDAPHAKILHLLKVLHKLNTLEGERSAFTGEKRSLVESAFINNKLTAKLSRQLEEPMIVASSCLPDWALDLPQHFPFLFPFTTRYNFLQSTSFGYARLILKWQSQQTRGQDVSRRDEGIGFLGRLQRQKVRISRKHILESAVKVFELYGSSSSILEVEYFEEVGTGLGPTLEFYSLVSKEFARRDLKIWRDSDPTLSGPYVHHPMGLFPAPISAEDMASDVGQKRTHVFRVIGQFVAKALLDSRIIDMHFNKVFLKMVLGEEVPLTIASLKLVDKHLANSLSKLEAFRSPRSDKLAHKAAALESIAVEDLALDFTIPGYDIELRPGGRDIQVTSKNVDDYMKEVLDAIIGTGAVPQAKAFQEGFSKVFPISDLRAFSPDELVMLFGNSDEDWSPECLGEALKADHGFTVDSRAIRDLVEIMSEFDLSFRRDYLQFITGSPKLPIGGFRGLNPPLTVVRKPYEAPLTADDYLPSVMTCVNYLKLPEYSSKGVMREKLRTAISEGVGSFHLS